MLKWWNDIGWILAVLVLHDLVAVILYDLVGWWYKLPSVSAHVRDSRLSWPIAICAAITAGVIVASHFVNRRLPGN